MNEKDYEKLQKITEKVLYVADHLLPPELVLLPDGVRSYVYTSQFMLAVLLELLEESGTTTADVAERLNEYKVFSESLKPN